MVKSWRGVGRSAGGLLEARWSPAGGPLDPNEREAGRPVPRAQLVYIIVGK